MSREYDEDVRSLVWFLAGIGVGATAALLFAPRSGKETRQILSRAAERGIDYAGDQAEALRDRAASLRDNVADRSRDLYDRGRELAKDVGEDAADLLNRGKKLVRG